jgi:hypothetical protein
MTLVRALDLMAEPFGDGCGGAASRAGTRPERPALAMAPPIPSAVGDRARSGRDHGPVETTWPHSWPCTRSRGALARSGEVLTWWHIVASPLAKLAPSDDAPLGAATAAATVAPSTGDQGEIKTSIDTGLGAPAHRPRGPHQAVVDRTHRADPRWSGTDVHVQASADDAASVGGRAVATRRRELRVEQPRQKRTAEGIRRAAVHASRFDDKRYIIADVSARDTRREGSYLPVFPKPLVMCFARIQDTA